MPNKNIDILDFDLSQLLPIQWSLDADLIPNMVDQLLNVLTNPLSQYESITIKTKSDHEPYARILKRDGKIVFEITNQAVFSRCQHDPQITPFIAELTKRYGAPHLAAPEAAPQKAQRVKKRVFEEPDFSYVPVDVNIGEEVLAQMRDADIQKEAVQQQCIEDFTNAQAALDKAIGAVLKDDPVVLNAIKVLIARLIQTIDCDAAKSPPADFNERKAMLSKQRTNSPGAVELSEEAKNLHEKLILELEKNKKIYSIVARSQNYDRETVEKGNIRSGGYHGLNAQATRNVAKGGNLREIMWVLFRGMQYTPNMLMDENRVKAVNQLLFERHGWMFDLPTIQEIIKNLQGKPLHTESRYWKEGTDRADKKGEELAEHLKSRPRVKDLEEKGLPLSVRERLALTGDHKVKPDPDMQPDYELGGRFKSGLNPDNPYTKTVNETHQPAIGAISGTSDRYMTQAMLLGCDTQEDLEIYRLACLAGLISTQNHTAHEILMSCKGFGLPYTPGPKGYLDIYPEPGKAAFVEKLKEKLAEKGFKLPDYYLSEEHIKSVVAAIQNPKKGF